MPIIQLQHNPFELHKIFMQQDPFPHIVIDNFLDSWVAQQIVQELDACDVSTWPTEHYDDQVLKFCHSQPELLPQSTGFVLRYFNSPIMLGYMSALTGIPQLMPDPSYLGAGVHVTLRGGHLSVHADFNIHHFLGLHRRVNVLIYLNQNWLEEWNGALELWARDMSRCVRKVPPIFNRAAIFNITDDAFHGVPDPVLCPPERKRFSLALYYYTKDRPEAEKTGFHQTLWQKRPG